MNKEKNDLQTLKLNTTGSKIVESPVEEHRRKHLFQPSLFVCQIHL